MSYRNLFEEGGVPIPPAWVSEALRHGMVIPAHPLALDAEGRFDERSQQSLTRYYHAAGAGGFAVGVHTTQFEIREPKHDLLRPVLELAATTARDCDAATGRRSVLVAGVIGRTEQGVREATLARDLGYHAGLLSLGALRDASEQELIDHARAVAGVIPLFGFYLQPAAGGRLLSRAFWRDFAAIPNVVGVKVAPFDRYATLDVIRGLAESGRGSEIALYTGNDDSIIIDLLTEYSVPTPDAEGNFRVERFRFAGGLLGHWAVWTRRAVDHLEQCRRWRDAGTIPGEGLTLAAQVTDANAAFFDAANGFSGCIAGIHEVLQRQGLLQTNRTLDSGSVLSPGQREEIDRVLKAYPHLTDDDFVREHLDEWRR